MRAREVATGEGGQRSLLPQQPGRLGQGNGERSSALLGRLRRSTSHLSQATPGSFGLQITWVRMRTSASKQLCQGNAGEGALKHLNDRKQSESCGGGGGGSCCVQGCRAVPAPNPDVLWALRPRGAPSPQGSKMLFLGLGFFFLSLFYTSKAKPGTGCKSPPGSSKGLWV